MNMTKEIFDSWGVIILGVLFVLLFILESIFNLRKRVQPRFKRALINFMVSLPSFAMLRLLFIPFMVFIAGENQSLQFGLNYLYEFPFWTEGVIAFFLLDYGNYLWHILNHKIPLLWRFHLVHHSDHDLDITTAFRFHFGELIGSLIFRGAFVLLTGADIATVLIYEIIFEGATQFHHSNTRIPFQVEKILSYIIVTPRMHGIHHSNIKNEADTNYSVIFSLWDRLHKTVKLNIGQNQVVIGVPAYSDHNELTIWYLLKLPFTKIRGWKESHFTRNGDETANKLKP